MARAMGAQRKDLAVEAKQWETLAAEVLTGIKDWRTQHPRATFTEIEGALDDRLSRLRARLLEDVALASAATAATAGPGGAGEAGERVACPTCGGRLEHRGPATRAVTLTRDQTVTLARSYTVCASCGAGVFPPG